MNSSKIKTFLIILLAFVNIFLIINLFIAKSSDSYLSGEMLEASLKALAHKGIYVEKSQIPDRKYNQAVISADCSEKARLASAQDFLGKIVAEYSLPDGITYQSENAYVTFLDNGTFEYGLLENKSMQSDISVYPPSSQLESADRNTIKKFNSLFKKLVSKNSADDLGYVILGQTSENENEKKVYAYLTVDGMSVHDSNFVMVFNDGTPIYASGKFFFDTFKDSYSKEYIDAPNALFLLDGNNASVKDIEMVYYSAVSNENEYFLIPSWKITLDSGKIKIFDGVSGYERQ